MQKIRAIGATLLLCLTLAGPGHAGVARGASMAVGEQTTQPIGHHLLCIELPKECEAQRAATFVHPVPLTKALMQTVASINVATNAAIKAASDRDLYGVEERWTYPTDRGDCEDYALLKRRLLHAAGIAYSNLLMTVVKKPDGEGHAILTLRTSQGDFVLDNLNARVTPWTQVPYTFLKRQSSLDPARWTAIEDGADVLVGAVAQ
ncbi:transglutaminase-like cysteine peptidase [Aurantimonas sp. Leaf443]|uniref:transglutaminase-like cysteine peptidase n=1 Tax=Aurantimonas sp. Leaf443 TaxID=1736378 RepID=UPI0006F20F35|nr:transglutaminase-like cysteine peptidase [Aurantimonas sp. Leaf443]KQT83147.1 transglutaminase [Aurantimonas sp. Leaf443]